MHSMKTLLSCSDRNAQGFQRDHETCANICRGPLPGWKRRRGHTSCRSSLVRSEASRSQGTPHGCAAAVRATRTLSRVSEAHLLCLEGKVWRRSSELSRRKEEEKTLAGGGEADGEMDLSDDRMACAPRVDASLQPTPPPRARRSHSRKAAMQRSAGARLWLQLRPAG